MMQDILKGKREALGLRRHLHVLLRVVFGLCQVLVRSRVIR
jgi:hypothetical protein